MSASSETSLFSTYLLGSLQLPNRMVMASMTRGRARNVGLEPTALHVEYYRQRAAAGLIMSEATWVSKQAIGSINVPGLFSDEQTIAWRAVTDAVHAAGGRIYAQLGHSGAVSHPDFFGGELPLAPSAVNPGQKSFTPSGFKDTVTPRAMTVAEIETTISDYGVAARNARRAGFDGVELHAAAVYLLPQFLNSALNQRFDHYGGSPENRARIILEILKEMIEPWGAGKVGIKIGPTARMGGFGPTQETRATYDYLVERLNDLELSHLQLTRTVSDLTATPIAALQNTVSYYRRRYRGTLIANGGFDAESGHAEIASRRADLISFATPFIGNPDLVNRWQLGLPLASSNRDTYYQGEAAGYVDYPVTA